MSNEPARFLDPNEGEPINPQPHRIRPSLHRRRWHRQTRAFLAIVPSYDGTLDARTRRRHPVYIKRCWGHAKAHHNGKSTPRSPSAAASNHETDSPCRHGPRRNPTPDDLKATGRRQRPPPRKSKRPRPRHRAFQTSSLAASSCSFLSSGRAAKRKNFLGFFFAPAAAPFGYNRNC